VDHHIFPTVDMRGAELVPL